MLRCLQYSVAGPIDIVDDTPTTELLRIPQADLIAGNDYIAFYQYRLQTDNAQTFCRVRFNRNGNSDPFIFPQDINAQRVSNGPYIFHHAMTRFTHDGINDPFLFAAEFNSQALQANSEVGYIKITLLDVTDLTEGVDFAWTESLAGINNIGSAPDTPHVNAQLPATPSPSDYLVLGFTSPFNANSNHQMQTYLKDVNDSQKRVVAQYNRYQDALASPGNMNPSHMVMAYIPSSTDIQQWEVGGLGLSGFTTDLRASRILILNLTSANVRNAGAQTFDRNQPSSNLAFLERITRPRSGRATEFLLLNFINFDHVAQNQAVQLITQFDAGTAFGDTANGQSGNERYSTGRQPGASGSPPPEVVPILDLSLASVGASENDDFVQTVLSPTAGTYNWLSTSLVALEVNDDGGAVGLLDVFENQVLDQVFRAQAGVASFFVGYSTTTPAEDGTNITEPSDPSYARLAIPSFSAAAGGAISNDTVLTFGTATVAQGDVTHWVVYDALTGGNALVSVPVNGGALTVNIGDTPQISVGALTIRAD